MEHGCMIQPLREGQRDGVPWGRRKVQREHHLVYTDPLDCITDSMDTIWANSRRVEDGGARCGAVHGITRSRTRLSDWITTATAALDPCLLLRYAIHLLSYNFMFELHCAGVAEGSPQIPLFVLDCVYILGSFHSAEGPDRRSHALQTLPKCPSSHLVVSFQPTQVLRRTSLIPGTKVL